MKKIWGVGGIACVCGLAVSQVACSGGAAPAPASEQGEGQPKIEELIGSVSASSKSLDGIGSIGYVYDYGDYGGGPGVGGSPGFGGSGNDSGGAVSSAVTPAAELGGWVSAGGSLPSAGTGGGITCGPACQSPFYAQCTATLISKNSVLTSRNCAALFDQQWYGPHVKFAIGADSRAPTRLVDVVAVEYAPATVSGGSVTYPDLAVAHLGESISDVTPFAVTPLTDDLVGKQLAGLGFGNSDRRYQSGTRRAGALTLNATSGLLYPAIFGSFEAFYTYSLSGGGYGGGPVGSSGAFSVLPIAAVPVPAAGGGPAGGFGNIGGAGGFPSAGGAAGGGEDWYRQYLQQQYDTVALAPGEAYLGGQDSDAQPCGADQGGPIVRKLQGQVRVFGVFSRTPFGSCDKGGIYASISASSKAFIDAAAKWQDPCSNTTETGKCVGTVATRCSTAAEGARRLVKLDCSLLNQVCLATPGVEVTCTDK